VGKPSAMNSSDTSVPGRRRGTNGGRQGSKAVVGNAGADCATCGGQCYRRCKEEDLRREGWCKEEDLKRKEDARRSGHLVMRSTDPLYLTLIFGAQLESDSQACF
jgi:hypothetical protein